MRVIYIDIDSLRPDHLGCYGYQRATSPHIDALAQEGVRFESVYISDAPCLPSRTALWSGRAGFHTGVVGHGGTAAQPIVDGPSRGFTGVLGQTSWMSALRAAGLRTATVSSFGERHGAWHWYAGYNEILNPGKGGLELADEVNALAIPWLQRNAAADNWFLHINYWDPHTPYRTPESFGNPFADEPVPAWLTEAARERMWRGFGPHSAQEPHGWGGERFADEFPRVPAQIDSPDAVRRWIDGYDAGIRYADEHIGQLLETLGDLGVLDETLIVVGADHGESQGELNVWGDHQTADTSTGRVPLIMRGPGIGAAGRVDRALHYHYDWAATLIELAGGVVPPNWDGESFAAALAENTGQGRPFVVTSQGAWACQRGVRFGQYLLLSTYHDGLKELEPLMLFDVAADPHLEHDLTATRIDVVQEGLALLNSWQTNMLLQSTHNTDPLATVLREGGPYHTRGELPQYAARLRATGRAEHAARIEQRHPDEARPAH